MLIDPRPVAPPGSAPATAPGSERSREAAPRRGLRVDRFGHQRPLDGLRGVAVGGVLLFHAGISWVAGGFIGIDIFFVLSGFLITTLLLGEVGRTGRVHLRQFWERRIRRLMPALLALLGVAALWAWLIAEPNQLGRIRRDGLGTLFYVSNWLQVTDKVGYFDHFTAPSPLLHTWSLAVEEQYYLVWPVVVAALARWTRRDITRESTERKRVRAWRSMRLNVGRVAVLGAIASASLMIVGQMRGWSVNRLYFGTDTRGQALLIGSALAVFRWGRWRQDGDTRDRPTSVTLDLIGLAGLAVLVVAGVRHWSDAWLGRGGYTVIALAAAAVIAAAVQPGPTRVGGILAVAPLRWLGRISYGAYLWHWPIFQYLTPARTGLDFWPLTALRLGATILAAVLSLRLIEEPLRHRRGWPLWWAPIAAAVVAVALVASTAGAVVTDNERFARDQTAAPPTEAAPVAPASTKVLVVGDSLASSVAANWSTVGSPVEVIDRSFAGCGVAAPTACGDWTTAWPQAIAETKPDLTLLVVRSWQPLSRNPAMKLNYDLDIAKPNNLLLDDMQSVLDVTKGSGGLAIATLPLASLPPPEQTTAKMIDGIARQLANAESDAVATHELAGAQLVGGPGGAVLDTANSGATRAELATFLRATHLARWRAAQAKAGGAPAHTKVLVVGDSIGWSLGSYWYGQSGTPGPDDPIRLWNRAQFFCELDSGPRLERNGKVELSDKCKNWRQDWARYVQQFQPDVVLLMVGSWEVFDRRIDGKRLVFGTPEADAHLAGLLQEAVTILSAGGAKVVVATQPTTVAKPDPGAPREWWDNPQSRFDHVDQLLRNLVAANPQTTTLVDLAAKVCPTSPCPDTLDGVALRPDGVHYGADGGPVVSQWLSPQLRRIHLDSIGGGG